MSIKQLFSNLLSSSNHSMVSKRGESQLPLPPVERRSYRDFLLENADGSADSWKAKINNNVVSGDLEFIKTSIDWWCDRKMILPQKEADTIIPPPRIRREIVIYRGFKIINDTGEKNGWYMLHKGKLLKGTKSAIEEQINLAIRRTRY